MHELTWRNEKNDLNWINEMKELKWRNWPEWIETNEVKQMNWNEWIEINELKWMNWKESIAKSAPNPHFFHVFFFLWNGRSRDRSLCTLCRPLSPDRGAKPRGNRDLLAATTGRPRTFNHAFPIAQASQLLDDGWHDDVVDMMIEMMLWWPWWLKWWCGCHDDWDDDVVAMMVRQLAIDNRP